MRISPLLLGVSLIAVALPAAAQTVTTKSGTKKTVVVRVAPAPTPTPAPGPAPDTTLRDALVAAYNTNPDLAGERANLRANDENVPIARSQGLPGVTSTGALSQSVQDTDSTGFGPTRTGTVGLNLSVPIYSGGSVRNSVRAAEVRVEGGRSNLRATEADVFTQAVTVYVDVIRDEAIVRLNQQNQHALEVNLQATRDRFEVGDLTRTDVAQSESRLALAESQLASAEAQLIASRENYIRVIGTPPGILAQPTPLPNLPQDTSNAVETALANNPNLQAAEKNRSASKFDVDVARAGRLPRVSVGVGTNYYNYLGSLSQQAVTLGGLSKDGIGTTAGVNLSLPLFQGGRPAAQIRQAQARQASAMENYTLVERGVVAQARSNFAACQASQKVIDSTRVAVEASRLSLEGVRAENSVGTRTILDILNAEQEFLNAQVQYVSAERNSYVACFNLLAAMGQVDAEDLGLDGGPLYNPVDHYDTVKHRIFDWGSDPEPEAMGTRTINTPAQTKDVKGSLDPLLDRPVDSTRINP
jgi:outer membrane protein